MSCEDVKKIIPAYANRIASEEETSKVEEHLCICNDCREFLSQHMDKPFSQFKLNGVSDKDLKKTDKIVSKSISSGLYVI